MVDKIKNIDDKTYFVDIKEMPGGRRFFRIQINKKSYDVNFGIGLETFRIRETGKTPVKLEGFIVEDELYIPINNNLNSEIEEIFRDMLLDIYEDLK